MLQGTDLDWVQLMVKYRTDERKKRFPNNNNKTLREIRQEYYVRVKAGDWPPETETQSKKEKAEEATAMIAQKLWTRLCQSSRKTLILKVVPRSPRSHAITVVSLVTLQGIVQSQRGNRTTRNR